MTSESANHSAVDYVLSVQKGRSGLLAAVLRFCLSVLAVIYCLGLEIYLAPYRLGLRRRYKLPCPVICIGNLTTGGTGKTPMTHFLCSALAERGYRLAILSRGYRGRNEFGAAIVSDTAQVLLAADEAGDEAYLLARGLPGIPVIVGKDRRKTGTLALERFHPDLLVMDDGLQFWQLHRDLDIVMLDAMQPFGNGWTLPRGLLREPPGHLRRAAIAVLSGIDRISKQQAEESRRVVARVAPDCRLYESRVRPVSLQRQQNGEILPPGYLDGRSVGALCGLGNPGSFEQSLQRLGARVKFSQHLQDHARITEDTWQSCIAGAESAGAECIVITEKDAVKAAAPPVGIDVLILHIAADIEGEVDLINRIVEAVDRRGAQGKVAT